MQEARWVQIKVLPYWSTRKMSASMAFPRIEYPDMALVEST